jgi:predicted TPR repeat methyltransferase
VPKLVTKVLGWLDVQPDDKILDVGCGGESDSLSIRDFIGECPGP